MSSYSNGIVCLALFRGSLGHPEELEELGLFDLRMLREKEGLHVKKRWSTKTNNGLEGPSDLYK